MKKLILILLILVAFKSNCQTFAFPEAYGAAAFENPARQGAVIHVTTLADNGDSSRNEVGTLRWALQNSANKSLDRIIVFDVSGVIDLQSRIYASNSPGDEGGYTGTVYIAGQTAPEGGITITGDQITLSGFPVIARYLKFRHQPSNSGTNGTLALGRGDFAIIDHCSFSHHSPSKSTVSIATKNNSDVNDFTKATFSHNLMGQNKLGFIAGETTPTNANTNGEYTVYRNAYYNISHRVPLKGGAAISVDVINNIVHNWGSRMIRMDGWAYKLNHFENYYQAGGNTTNTLKWTSYLSSNGTPQIYTQNNFLEDDPRGSYSVPTGFDTDESVAWTEFQNNFVPIPNSYFTSTQHAILGRNYTVLPNNQLIGTILTEVGACKYINDSGVAVFERDVYDTEYVEGITNNSGSTRSTTLVLPIQTSSNTRPSNFYQSNPHIPEAYLVTRGITGSATIHNQIQSSGYTLLEEYVNQVDGDIITTPPSCAVDTATNLFTNPCFEDATGWQIFVAGNISNGVANVDGSSSVSLIGQDVAEHGKNYRIRFTVSNYVDASGMGLMDNSGTIYRDITANGDYDFTFTMNQADGDGRLFWRARNGGSYSVDNVVLEELTCNLDADSNLVTNPCFNLDSSFNYSNVGGTHGWRHTSNGTMICDDQATAANRNLQQDIGTLEIGKTYRVTLDIIQSTDTIVFIFGGQNTNLPTGQTLGHTFDVTATSTSGLITIYAGTSDLQEIDNLVIEEINTDIAVTSVELTPSTQTIEIGRTTNLTTQVLPNDATDQTGVWSSSNNAVATVTQSGIVTGISAGTSTIAFTANDDTNGVITGTSVITVATPPEAIETKQLIRRVKVILISN